MKKWDKLPEFLKVAEIKPFYDLLRAKWLYRFVKRTFDIFASILLLVLLLIPSFIIALVVACTSKGGSFFVQQRVGRYGNSFGIVKFRTMRVNSEGTQQITYKNDSRITKVGKFLRKTHFDEFPQLLNVICGQMSFVGTRPEVKTCVDKYLNEWNATLLMRPGVTSTASYSCDDEAKFMTEDNVQDIYLEKILPHKMSLNLMDIKKASLFWEIGILFKTVF